MLICFLALVLVLLAETRTGATWRTIRAELGQIRQGHFRSSDGDFTQTRELTVRQRELHAQLGIAEPPRFGRITAAAAEPAWAHALTAPKRPRSHYSYGIACLTRTYLVQNSGEPAELRSRSSAAASTRFRLTRR